MAMIKCPECGKKISDKAEKCVHCGCPIPDIPVEWSNVTVAVKKKPITGKQILTFIIAFVVCLAITIACGALNLRAITYLKFKIDLTSEMYRHNKGTDGKISTYCSYFITDIYMVYSTNTSTTYSIYLEATNDKAIEDLGWEYSKALFSYSQGSPFLTGIIDFSDSNEKETNLSTTEEIVSQYNGRKIF